MKDSLKHYDPIVRAIGERLYSEMNTGDFWKLGVDYVTKSVCLPTVDKALQHFFVP
jgi:hypothetical protein